MELRWKDILKQLKATTRAKGQPYFAGLELTARCNFHCKMCYVCKTPNDKEAQARELTARQWISLAEEMREAGVFMLTLTGGDVFIRPDFREIYEALSKMGFLIKILTNGSMVTPEIIKWLSKMPPYMIKITLYGESPDTYQAVTGYADGYARSVRAIDRLMAAGITTDICTTFINCNVDNINLIQKMYRERGKRLSIIDYVAPRREGCETDPRECRLSPEEWINLKKHLHNIYVQEKINSGEKAVASDDKKDGFGDDCQEVDAVLDQNYAFRCGVGENNLWITWDGRMIPCSLMDQPYVTILDKGFSAAWQELKHKCELIPPCCECSKCTYRDLCASCPARLLRETGFYDRPAPYLCETSRLLSEYLKSLDLERRG